MRTNGQTASLSNGAFLLTAPGPGPVRGTALPLTAPGVEAANLTLARQTVLRAQAWEDMAWLGLAVSALVVLALSLA